MGVRKAEKKQKTKAAKVTPLMKQYHTIKAKYPDAMLLFRVGDFYETFGDDAVRAARILNIVQTKRGNGSEMETALAGFPHHSLNTYLPKLVKAGERVAICDQLEDPKQTKTIVKRGVTELVTPGVALNDEVLEHKSNNFLCALHFGKKAVGVSFLDISTGEYLVAEGDEEYIDKLIQNFSPSEILVEKRKKKQYQETYDPMLHQFYLDDWVFKTDYATDTLHSHFDVKSLKGFGIQELREGIIAAGVILHYLKETQHDKLQHISKINRIAEDAYVWMDRFTMRNLELFQGSGTQSVSLLECIDRTLSPMGGRTLKRWLALPLKSKDRIEKRHQVVTYFKDEAGIRFRIVEQLKKVGDLERLISKVATQKICPREVVQLKNALKAIGPIKQLALESSNEALRLLGDTLQDCEILQQKIEKTLDEEAPVLITKGNTIANGYCQELDELRSLSLSGKTYLDEMLKRESEATGIPSLKIASNNVFGYYIEVRNTHKAKVPESWTRKQTLVSAERYITDELKTYEAKILGAEEKIGVLEIQLFEELLLSMHPYIQPIQHTAQAIGQLDCLCSFAQLAIDCDYHCPEMTEEYTLDITDGRHPVIERQLPVGESYISNDVQLDTEEQQFIMITGPNMSGKSALLRQTALIVVLAQIGCFVPAQSASIGVVDKIFTRVGASDNISQGESTFMVEMTETASILNNLSKRSLVILDEIGRGTSTYDGISIAWAISEYLHEHPYRPKVLFATHYHELNEMQERFLRIRNYNVSIKETENTILFLRKLVPGGSEHSFGIHVARMAGMPQTVVQKAEKLLVTLENAHREEELGVSLKEASERDLQLSMFTLDDPLLDSIKSEILSLDIDTLTPVEALMKLNEIKRILVPKKLVKA